MMQTTLIGYARTSTAEQEAGLLDQISELEALGCRKVFSEQVSAVDAKRPKLAAALDYVREGDTLVVTKPDRLARSTADLLSMAEDLKKRGVGLRVLSMGAAGDVDTGSATGKLLLTMLAAIAEFERTLMKERQLAGIAKAKLDKTKYAGRKPTARAQADVVVKLRAEGVKTAEIAKRTGMGVASVFRILKDGREGVAGKAAGRPVSGERVA